MADGIVIAKCGGGVRRKGPSAEELDGEPAWGLEVERPGAVLPRRFRDVEPVLPEPAVDLVHAILALLDEADVERGRVANLGLAAELHAGQGEDHAVVVEQEGDVVVAAAVLQAEVRFEELVGLGDVRDGEVQVVELHFAGSLGSCSAWRIAPARRRLSVRARARRGSGSSPAPRRSEPAPGTGASSRPRSRG